MTELKTLKDLKDEFNGPTIPIDDLRQEAIKWIKSKKIITPKKGHTFDPFEIEEIKVHQSAWIKHFFNITEADLQ